jgi:hypothetical protein
LGVEVGGWGWRLEVEGLLMLKKLGEWASIECMNAKGSYEECQEFLMPKKTTKNNYKWPDLNKVALTLQIELHDREKVFILLFT